MTAGHGHGIVGRIYRNLALLLGGKAAAGLISLIYLAIAARILGPADFGRLALISGYTLVIGGIVNFPGWHAVVRYGAPAVAAGDAPRLFRLMRFTAKIELAAGACAVLIAALAAPALGPHLGIDREIARYVAPYSLAVLATVRTTPTGLLQLLGRFRLIGAHTLVNPLVRLAGTIVVAVGGFGLPGFLIAWLVAALAECLSMWALGWWCVRRTFPSHPPASAIGAARENPGLLRFMLLANADATFADLSPRVALLIVGWVLGPIAAGLYSVGQRATVVIAQPAILLGQASYSELAHLITQSGTAAMLRRALLRCIGIALASASPILVVLALFPTPIVDLLAGSAFAAASGIMLWLMIARVVRVAAPPLSAALIALGRPSLSVAANVAAGLLLLPALPLLMRISGLAGAGYFSLLEAMVAVAILGGFTLRSAREG
jgi:O-antigen/teichoic acid export membrane protein